MKKENDLSKLTSTQRLPVIGKFPLRHDKTIVCRRCHQNLFLPAAFTVGHARCRFCGELHRIGIPPQYIRIGCKCGKILTAHAKLAGQRGHCPGCGKVWTIPSNSHSASYEKSARKTSGKDPSLVSRGIPPHYVRIACDCGKILTAHKRLAGQRGRCPNCGRTYTVKIASATIPEDKIASTAMATESSTSEVTENAAPVASELIGIIRFKCSCGQSHMVEAQKTGSTILCFRCQSEVQVPILQRDTSNVHHSIRYEDKRGQELWCLQTPYPADDLFALLEIPFGVSISEIKTACRTIQSQIPRENPKFQKVQLAKDVLTRAETRLWYEMLVPQWKTCWKQFTRSKLARWHDDAIVIHQKAIEMEKERLFTKADLLWGKTMNYWLKLLSHREFGQCLERRGQALFPNKFKPEILQILSQRLLTELLVNVNIQFRERYLGEHNLMRADFHLKVLAPVLQYRWDIDPVDVSNRELLIAYLTNEIQSLVDRGLWKKIVPLLLQLNSLTGYNRELQNMVREFFCLAGPYISKSQRTNAAINLGISQA